MMAHNAKLTFPIIEEAPIIVKDKFLCRLPCVPAMRGKGSLQNAYFPLSKQNGFAMRSFCQKVIARR